MVFQVITGIDGVDLAFRGTYRIALAFVLVGLFYWVKQVARDLGVWNQPNRLLLYALVLSCIPFALLTVGDPRVLTIPHAIYALFLARMFYQYLQVNVIKIHVKVFLGLSLLGQIIIPIFIWAAASYMVPQGIGLKDEVKTVNYDALEEFPIQDKHVVIVNSPDPFVLMYYPYKAVYRDLPLPLSIRQLMLNIEPMELVRLSEYEFEITQKGGMSFVPLDYESHLFPKLNQSTEDMHYLFQGFFHDGKAKFEDRQKFEFPEMLIRLKHNVDNRPETISVKIDWDAMDNIVWLRWSWDSYEYEIFTLPAIGKSIDFRGQFE